MASDGGAGLLPISRCPRELGSVARLLAARLQALAECFSSSQSTRPGALGTSVPHPVPVDLNPAFCIPIPMFASPPLILGKSRVRKRARTDLCGGRSAMVVPTATVIPL